MLICFLQDYTNEDLKQRKFLWSLDNVTQLSRFLFVVEDERRRTLVEEVLQAWQEKVLPLLPKFEKG